MAANNGGLKMNGGLNVNAGLNMCAGLIIGFNYKRWFKNEEEFKRRRTKISLTNAWPLLYF